MSDAQLVAQGSHLQQLHMYLRGFARSSLGGMEGIKGERNEQQSDGAENHDQNGSYLDRIEVEKVKFLM